MIFSASLPIFGLVFYFSNMLHDGFRHADGFTFSFALMQKNKVTKRKNQGYVSGPTPERPFWRWKMNSLRCTALRQHFSAPPGHSYAHAPTTRPVFFLRQGASLLALGFMLTCLRLLLFVSVFLYAESVKYLSISISHWKLCIFARNSLYLGWVYIYLT